MEERKMTDAENAARQYEGLPKLLDTAKDIEKKISKKETTYQMVGNYLIEVYTSISDAYRDKCSYKKSLKYLKKAMNTCEIMAAINYEFYGKHFYLTKLKLYSYYHEIAKNDKKADKYLFEGLDAYEKWCEMLPEHYPDLAQLYYNFAILSFSDTKRASIFQMKEFAVYQKLYENEPEKYAVQYVSTCSNAADEYIYRKEYDKAEQILKECLTITRKLAEEDYEKYKNQLAWANKDLGRFFLLKSKDTEAQPLLTDAEKIFKELYESEPENIYALSLLISVTESLADSYCNDKQKCKEYFEKAFELIQKGIEKEPEEYTFRLARRYVRYGEAIGNKDFVEKGKELEKQCELRLIEETLSEK